MHFTLKDVVEFCIEYKGKKGFKEYDFEDIAKHIIEKAQTNELLIVEDSGGICGVCTYELCSNIHINQLVATRTGFATIVCYFNTQFKEHLVTGYRNSKFRIFNKEKIWATCLKETEFPAQKVKQSRF